MRALPGRILTLLGTMLAVSFIVYGVLEADSSSVAVKVLGQFSTVPQRTLWLHEHGYDRPFLVRYAIWLWHFVRGDWGNSLIFHEPVALLLPERLANTAILALATLVVTIPIAFLLGIIAGVREGSPADRVVTVFCVLTTSVPDYASAVFLSALLVFGLHWVPGASTMLGGFDWRQLVLPVLVLSLSSAGYLARITRASVAETMAAPYVRTALMKGASPSRIVARHALRNAMIAPVTVIMLQIPWLLSGVIVVEVFFAYRGFGSLLYQASVNSDIAVVEACAMVSVIVVVATQIISDLLYVWLNPRLRRVVQRAIPDPSAVGTAPAGAAP